MAGLATGWRLAQAGAEVIVLERAQAGRGATWASAGMISPAGENISGADAAFGRWSSELWPGFAAELEEQSGVSIDYRRDGALLVATDPQAAAVLAKRATEENGLEMLDRPQALVREPLLSPLIEAALWAAEEARVDSRMLGPALARAFSRAGGNLQLDEAAVRLEVEGNRVIALQTPFHKYHADAFVIAAGAWSGQIFGLPAGVLPPVKPIKGEMIAYTVPQGSRSVQHVLWGNEIYLVPRQDRLLVGATVGDVGFDTSVTSDAREWLGSRAAKLIPEIGNWQIHEHWAGLRPAAPDGLPILGETKLDGLFVATGQYRNGILFAPALAELMRGTILDGALPKNCAAFDPRRFG